MGLCPGGALRVESPGCRPDRSGVAEPARVPRQPEDEIAVVPMGQPLHALWGGEMPVPTDEEMGPRPGAPQRGQVPDHPHRVFCAERALPRTAAGGHAGRRGACENEARQIARALGVLVIEGELLRPRRRVIGVLSGAPNSRRGLGRAGEEVGHPGLGQARESLAVHTVG
jgi:hypothetical protein